jgi:hypothetical protein
MVWSSGIVRPQHTPPSIIPQRGQVTEHGSEISMRFRQETWDVFQERESRSYNANGIPRGRPHVARVVLASLLSGAAERLARKSGCNDINHALIRFGVPITDECSDIAEDRGVWDESISYPRS